MTKTIKTISYDNRVRLFWTLTALSLLSLFVYIVAIGVTTRSVALRQNLERQSAKVSANLDALEFAYIELKNNVTIELAHERGFKEIKDPLYVSRRAGSSLSFNTINR